MKFTLPLSFISRFFSKFLTIFSTDSFIGFDLRYFIQRVPVAESEALIALISNSAHLPLNLHFLQLSQ